MSREKDQEQKRENIREQADSQGTDAAETKQSPLTEEVLKKQEHSEERLVEGVGRKSTAEKSGEAYSSEDAIRDESKGEKDAA